MIKNLFGQNDSKFMVQSTYIYGYLCIITGDINISTISNIVNCDRINTNIEKNNLHVTWDESNEDNITQCIFFF